jgi:hypothetical protein
MPSSTPTAHSDWLLPVGIGVGAFVLLLLIFAAILLLRRRSRTQASETVGTAMTSTAMSLPTPSTGQYERVSSLLPESHYHFQTPPAARHEYDAVDSPLK